MSVAGLLDRLERVRPTGPSRWLALCPAHADRTPSLSIRERDDGGVLLNCFAGCLTTDVLASLGLEWDALFPPSAALPNPGQLRSRIPARDLLEIISEETSLVCVIAADLLAQKEISETDWQRLAQAASRIGAAKDHIHGR